MHDRAELVKGLGVYGATSVVAGTMIGTAIFVVPSLMLQRLGSPAMVLGVWLAAGVLSLFGALGYAELGAALPQAGGEYVYLHRAYGPMMGFLYGWTQFIVAKTASIAAIATGFLLYLAYFFPALSQTCWKSSVSLAGHQSTLTLTGIKVGSAFLIVLLSGINILGVRRSGAIQTLFTIAKIAVLAALIILGLTLGRGSWTNLQSSLSTHGAQEGALAGWGIATVSALWA